jgi:MFS family permease
VEPVGIALGAYGLTQAVLQVPFGWLSDRRGRKPVLYFGLLVFALGSFVCAMADAPWSVILGRVLQGGGAVSGVVIAMTADLTRESQRTKAMAIIGSTIGVVFAVSFVAAPSLQQAIGVPGIFAMTGVLAICAIAVVAWAVPDPEVQGPPRVIRWSVVLGDRELLRLNVGIFVLHAVLMALFVVVPLALVRAGLPRQEHWWVYLTTVGAGFVIMLPAVIGRGAARERRVFLCAVAGIALGIAVLAVGLATVTGIIAALVIFFAAFNVLEAKLPALVSRAAPREATGSATGVYSSVQFLGTFFGGAVGGAVAQYAGPVAVLASCLVATILWFMVAWNMGEFVAAPSALPRT